MSKYRIHSGPVVLFTDRQVAAVVVETAQMVLSEFKNVTISIENLIRFLCTKNS